MSNWQVKITQDGSVTFFSQEFGEAYHSLQGAKQEAFDKFATVTQLPQKAQSGHIALLDICYGLGYNTAAALETIWTANPHCQVDCYGLDIDPRVPIAALALETFRQWSPSVQSALKAMVSALPEISLEMSLEMSAFEQSCHDPRLNAQLMIGDARQRIQELKGRSLRFDAIFLDPFSPQRCPQLWTVEFLTLVAGCLGPVGTLATYSRSAAVRAGLIAADLSIGTMPVRPSSPSGTWAQGTLAAWSGVNLPALSPMEQEHLQTRAAIPFRDPSLGDSAKAILVRQKQEQYLSPMASTSSWRKRWKLS